MNMDEKELDDLEEAYKAGYEAQQNGVWRSLNPYDDDDLYLAWNEGWLQAAWDE
jgi:ribosome modulation factor